MRGRLFSILWAVAPALGACSLLDHPNGGVQVPAGGSGGDAGAVGDPGDECPLAGAGHIDLRVSGLPDGAQAGVILRGPRGSQAIFESRVLEGIGAGPYALDVARVASSDPIVRSVYEYVTGETAFCLRDGASHQVEIGYRTVPTSHRLWISTDSEGAVLGFSAASLTSTTEAAPEVTALTSAGGDLTFDADGNLWTMAPTSSDTALLRLTRGELEASGEKQPDRRISIAAVPCAPALRAFAFDLVGALWVRTCGGRIVKLEPTDLANSGDVTPQVLVEGLSDVDSGQLAFDIAGNLWLVDGNWVLRFDGPRLGAPGAESSVADLALTLEAADARALTPGYLAFDGLGNLWVSDVAESTLARVAHADLQGTGLRTVTAQTLPLAAPAALGRPAFDESGGLWIALDLNRFGRLSPSQLALTAPSDAGEPMPIVPEIVITSPAMGNARRMVLYPASAGLPLHHRLQ